MNRYSHDGHVLVNDENCYHTTNNQNKNNHQYGHDTKQSMTTNNKHADQSKDNATNVLNVSSETREQILKTQRDLALRRRKNQLQSGIIRRTEYNRGVNIPSDRQKTPAIRNFSNSRKNKVLGENLNTHHRIEQFDHSFIHCTNNDTRYANGIEMSIDAYGNHPMNNRKLNVQPDTYSNGYEHDYSNSNNLPPSYQDRVSNESISHSRLYNNQGNSPSLNTYAYPQGHAENHLYSQGQNYHDNNFVANTKHQNIHFQGNTSYRNDMKSEKEYHISSSHLSEKDRSYESQFPSVIAENNQEMNKMTEPTSIISNKVTASTNLNSITSGNIQNKNVESENIMKKANVSPVMENNRNSHSKENLDSNLTRVIENKKKELKDEIVENKNENTTFEISEALLKDPVNLRKKLMDPVPKSTGMLQCYIKRNKGIKNRLCP